MERKYWTKQELVEYFKQLSFEYKAKGSISHCDFYLGKAEAYEMAAFELENNMED